MSGEGIIEEWNPPHALRVRLTGAAPDPDSAAETPPSPQQFNEFLLESRGNRTVLRFVHSGIPSSSDWDGYYDGLDRGWQLFFLALRHYLENHRGEPRTNLVIMRPISGELNEAWKKFIEALGLPENPQGPDSLATANTAKTPVKYEGETSFGSRIAGEVLLSFPPKSLLLTVKTLDDALLTATFEEMGGTTFFYMTLALFGDSPAAGAQVRDQWKAWANEIFPEPSPAKD